LEAVVEGCVDEVSTLADRYVGGEFCPPEVIVEGHLGVRATCIPAHVRHITMELLKNAARASIDAYVAGGAVGEMTPVRVRLSQGREEVQLQVGSVVGRNWA
jgi:hypothetical protein